MNSIFKNWKSNVIRKLPCHTEQGLCQPVPAVAGPHTLEWLHAEEEPVAVRQAVKREIQWDVTRMRLSLYLNSL